MVTGITFLVHTTYFSHVTEQLEEMVFTMSLPGLGSVEKHVQSTIAHMAENNSRIIGGIFE